MRVGRDNGKAQGEGVAQIPGRLDNSADANRKWRVTWVGNDTILDKRTGKCKVLGMVRKWKTHVLI